MKRILSGVLIGVLILCFAATSFALPDPVNKLSRGVANVLSAPLEIGKQITVEWRGSKSKQLAFLGGIFKGIGYTITRAGSGLVDILTFPFKLNEKLDPIMKPEYVFD